MYSIVNRLGLPIAWFTTKQEANKVLAHLPANKGYRVV